MKKLFWILILSVLLFSSLAPSFTYANEVEDLAKQLLTEELEELWEQYNNINGSWSNIIMTLNNQNWDRELLTSSVNMNDQLMSINFLWNEIVISDPNNVYSWIIIMDRNLWASESWTWENSYWFFYQWWNNYWFSSTWEVNKTTDKVPWNSIYNNSGIYRNEFYFNNQSYWSDNQIHEWLRWWDWDNSSNNRWYNNISETAENRRWPCPEWWHVPSAWEWSKVLKYWTDENITWYISNRTQNWIYSIYLDNDYLKNKLESDLKLIYPWYMYKSSNALVKYWQWDRLFNYMTSTPIKMFQRFQSDEFRWAEWNNYYWYSLRCFKNVYDPVLKTITFNTNWWILMNDIKVPKWNKLNLKITPFNNWLHFDGWYTDSNLNNLFDFNEPINSDFTLYAKWSQYTWTISISDPDNIYSWFTILDRNLWAEVSWTWKESFWYRYQWWNNHWFMGDKKVAKTYNLASWNNLYNNKWYYWTQMVVITNNNTDYWNDNWLHNWLWWWTEDNIWNNRWNDNIAETAENRRWPCPEWYHIPSAWEWWKLIEYRWKTHLHELNSDISIGKDYGISNYINYWSDFSNYFLLPFAWTYQISSNDVSYYISNSNDWYYRTSSPNNKNAKTLYMTKNYWYPSNDYYRINWQSIRCFKNEYEIPNIYKLSLNTNWWNSLNDIDIRWNHKIIWLPTPEREYSIFEWWYTDVDLNNSYDANNTINWNIKLFAKWWCISWYTLSDDLQSCEKISVKFNANWWSFTNGNTYKIESFTNNLKSNEIKYSHTPNIDNEWNMTSPYPELYSNNDVIKIPWAKKLRVTIKFWSYSSDQWCVVIREWEHPDYSIYRDTSDSVSWKLWWWNYVNPKNTREYIVEWDALTFTFKSYYTIDDSSAYWYYAIIEEVDRFNTEYLSNAFDNIPTPTRNWYDFAWWYFDNWTYEHKFNESEVITWGSMNVYAKWKSIEEKMQETPSTNVGYTSNTTVSIDNELNDEVIDNSTTISLVTKEVEDDEVVTWDDKVLVQNTEIQVTSDKTVEYQWWLEVYLEKTENNETTIITWTAKFSSPIAIKIPVSNWIEKVKIKVKHGNETFGFKWLTLNPENECNNWEAVNYKYNWEEIITTWDDTSKYVLIYTCSASTFVAYTENAKTVVVNESTSTPTSSAWWGRIISATTNKQSTNEPEHPSADVENKSVEQNTTTQAKEITIDSKLQQRTLSRWEVAVMTNILLDVYPQLVEWKQELNDVENACSNYADEQKFTKSEKKAITRLCKLSIMWIHADNNKPLDEFMVNQNATNDEFSKVINRSISTYNEKDLSTVKDALKKLEKNEENVEFWTLYWMFMEIKNIFN